MEFAKETLKQDIRAIRFALLGKKLNKSDKEKAIADAEAYRDAMNAYRQTVTTWYKRPALDRRFQRLCYAINVAKRSI